jgi:16S rRNA (cytosine1402-N4)-methyltransferase
MKRASFHQPVLTREIMELLAPLPGEVCVDLTVGGAGHAEAILDRLGENGKLIGLDRDEDAVNFARKRLARFRERAVVVHENFINLDRVLKDMDVTPNIFLMDLGLSSHQLETPERGFSFKAPGPLDMRMDKRQKQTAMSMLQELPEKDLKKIIREYGEERAAAKIAHKIAKLRSEGKSPRTTTELCQAVESVIPKKGRQRIHPATRTFMAVRIAVNNELENLKQALEKALEILAPGGRIGVISYHSLEDRIVKRFFAQKEKGCICPPDAPVCTCGRRAEIRILTKKPVRPLEAELRRNPRSRSARARACQKLSIKEKGAIG